MIPPEWIRLEAALTVAGRRVWPVRSYRKRLVEQWFDKRTTIARMAL